MVKVIRAEHAGACYGVQRALDLAFEATKHSADVKSLGPLIHNPLVVDKLKASGIGVVDKVGDVQGGTVIIRSHGIGPDVRRELSSTGVRIIDATCPHVYRAQRAAADLAADFGTLIVIGDAQHPEVEGLRACAEAAGGTVYVVGGPDEVPSDLPDKVGVVVQTTQSRDLFDSVLEAIQQRGSKPQVEDTICSATTKRQAAAAELAAKVDALVVIGGHNSSNTTRLFEICKSICPRTFHIETADELDASAFRDCDTVGVTAGASTPEDQITSVVDYLEPL